MRVTVIGSHLCPDTLYALNRLSEAKAEIDFKNLSSVKTAESGFPALSWRTGPLPGIWTRYCNNSPERMKPQLNRVRQNLQRLP